MCVSSKACMARPDSDMGTVIRPDCFRFRSHAYHSISWQQHHPVVIAYSFLCVSSFPRKSTFAYSVLHGPQECLLMCKHPLRISIELWCCNISKSPMKKNSDLKQMFFVVHMLTQAWKCDPQTDLSTRLLHHWSTNQDNTVMMVMMNVTF